MVKCSNFTELSFGTSSRNSFEFKRFMTGCFFSVLLTFFMASNSLAYTPPFGIPNPAIYFSTFGEIDQPTPSSAAKCPNWPSAPTTGCYYIDKTHPICTSTNNAYGYPNKPRCTPPEGILAAGSYVYVHAGTYTSDDSAGDRFDWSGLGTANNPIWITGQIANSRCTASNTPASCCTGAGTGTCSNPIIQDMIHIGEKGSASYLVFENFQLNNRFMVYGDVDSYNIDHVIIRYNVFIGTKSTVDRTPVTIGHSYTTDLWPNTTTANIVIYNNIISNYGQLTTSEIDGIGFGYHTNFNWVLNNTIHDIGADGIGAGHRSNYTTMTTKNIFIGGNNIYSNGENCIDLKTVDGFVISGNVCTGPCSREQGWGIILHYGAAELPCRNGLIQYNSIYNVPIGIANGGSHGCDNCSYIGNKIYNVTPQYECLPGPGWHGYGIQIGGSHGTTRVTDNSFYNCSLGMVLVGNLTSTDVLINERNTISAVPLDTSSASPAITNTSSTSTTATGTSTTTTTVTGTTTTTTTIPITTSRGTPMWNKRIKLFRR